MKNWQRQVSPNKHASLDKLSEEQLVAHFRQEVEDLKKWYHHATEKTGRTAVIDYLPEEASQILGNYVLGQEQPVPTLSGLSFDSALRLATQDLKAFYFESLSGFYGDFPLSSQAFNRWFWNETWAGQFLMVLKEKCLNSPDHAIRGLARRLVPLELL